jgi:sugar O-acyltransferase (sialic acid O-acetyltransferase NeuD family)
LTAKPLVIWGASGHARVLHEFISRRGYHLVALFDNKEGLTSPIAGVPIYHGWAGFTSWSRERSTEIAFLVAIGGDRGEDRVRLHERLVDAGLTPVSITHPTAFVAAGSELAPGCQVMANAAVGVGSRLGMQTIVNTNASIDHECVLGAGVHIAPGATLCGCVEVGDYVLVGAGAVVLPRIRVGARALIGAGAVVTGDVPIGAVVVGNPARQIRKEAA